MKPEIKRVEFGSIEIDDEIFGREDFLLFWDGTVEPTKKTHEPDTSDAEKMLEKKPEIIIFGIGFSNCVIIHPDIKELVEKQGAEFITLSTPDALKRFEELAKQGKRVAARIHTTC